MARIVIADDGIEFDGRTPCDRPLGGAESSLINLAEALATRGHDVIACTNCRQETVYRGVNWTPIHTDHNDRDYGGLPAVADLYIANRGDRLIDLMPGAGRTVFWIHNPAAYIIKWRYLTKLWRARPVIVFLGSYHAATCPKWLPDGGRVTIPYGISETFLGRQPLAVPPPPLAIFTSNPLRGLDMILDLWSRHIRSCVPGARLRVYSGPVTYGAVGAAKGRQMEAVLDKARALADRGVVVCEPVAKEALADALRAARVMLYRGDENETFCLAVGEAQALGLPAVVGPAGSMAERVADGVTGFVARDDKEFGDRARRLLTDDDLWRRCHEAALKSQGQWTWDDAAAAFEKLITKNGG